MKPFIILLCLAANLLAACNSRIESSSIPTIQINIEKDKKTTDSLLFDQATIITLEATENSLIQDVSKVLSIDTLLYVFDSLQDYVYVFNKQGKFIARIGKHGQGPGEYTELYDVTIDPKKKELVLATPMRLQFYSLNNQFLNEISIPHYVSRIAIAGNKVIAQEFSGGYAIHEYTLNNHQLIKSEPIKNIPPITYNNFISPEGGNMTVWKDTIFYTRRFDPTIYAIHNGMSTPYVRFDFGSYKVTNENELPMETVTKRVFNIVSMPNNIRIKEERMFFNCFPFGLCTYNRATQNAAFHGKALHGTLKIKNTNAGITLNQMTEVWNEKNDLIVFTSEADKVKFVADRTENLTPTVQEKLIPTAEPDANPVLFFYHLR